MSNVDAEAKNLERLKSQMTSGQREQMSLLISEELKRRKNMNQAKTAKKSNVKSSGLSTELGTDDLGELYSGMEEQIKKLRLQKLQAKTRDKSQKQKISFPDLKFYKNGNFVLACSVVSLGMLKVVFSMNSSANVVNPVVYQPPKQEVQVVVPAENKIPPVEKEVLMQLDLRRVELEKRRESLDRREEELKQQDLALTEKLTELRSLTNKLTAARKEQDHRYEARMDQLANVYGSMDPNEAAPLIGKLEDQIALALLQRMPGKRMGQILSLMEKEQAVALTKKLTDKEELE